ncbi:hypothetical protein Taro_049345 [Colocasia esculenta]|uniref:Aminotransferase-like plant mobile domain-containing protein n=1 Tax=Colocasia esculenta TaxID=4460 RepID=A0A843XAN8_COLES|nr:hypothetical protein [Colocasia esculenta]
MRARVSWTLVLAVFLAFPPFQRERVEEMGFGEIFRIERMRVNPALTQALRSRWDAEASAFAFPWGHMIPSLEDVSRITGLRVYGRAVSGYTYPCYHELAEQLLDLPVERRSSLVPRVALQESLGLYEAGKNTGESEDEYLERLARVSRRELASEPGPQADLDLRRFLVLFLSRLLFATRGDVVHCRFLPLLEDLGEVGGYAWGAAFLAHQFDSLSASERQTTTSSFYPFLQVWAYLHLPALGRGDLTRPGLGERDRFRGEAQATRSERDQLRIQAEAAEAQMAEMTRELATLRVQRPPGDQEEVTRLCAELLAQQTLARSLQQIVTDIGRSRSQSRSGASVSRATGASVGQYLAGSSSKRRNEEEERRRQSEGSAHDGRGGGEMLPPPDRREGSGESGGGQ